MTTYEIVSDDGRVIGSGESATQAWFAALCSDEDTDGATLRAVSCEARFARSPRSCSAAA